MNNPNSKDWFEPGTFRALGYGWEQMKENFLVFFLVVLVLAVTDIPTNLDFATRDGEHAVSGSSSALFSFLKFAYTLLFVPVIKFGADLLFLRGVRGEDVEVKDIVEGFDNYLNVILASLLTLALIVISLLFLVIPGIYVACRLAFVAYLVMDEDLDPVEAVRASWRITSGHVWKIFCLGCMSFLIGVVGLLLLVVGLIPAVIWAKASFAAMYLSITAEEAELGEELG